MSVPTTPSTPIGTIARRKRRQPMCMPPSKRITISATTPIRSTVLMCGMATGIASAISRNSAGAGIGYRSVDLGRDEREHHAGRDDEDDQPEIAQLGHALTLTDSLHLPHSGHMEASDTSPTDAQRCWSYFVLALVLPVAAYSQVRASNGTLSIREGRGVVQLDARGSMTGRLNGRLTITDPKPFDSKRPVVYGATKTIYRNAKTTVYQGKNVRFRLGGARFVIRMDGKAIFLSAIAHGTGHARRCRRPGGERLLRRRLVAERRALPLASGRSDAVRARPPPLRDSGRLWHPERCASEYAANSSGGRGRGFDRLVRLAVPEERRVRRPRGRDTASPRWTRRRASSRR